TDRLIVLVWSDGTVCDLRLLVDREQLRLSEVLEDVAHAEHDHGVADDQYALAAVLARNHLGYAAQAEYHIAPALTTGWPVIEFSQQAAEFCLVRELLLHADGRQSVEYSEFLLAKSLVDDQRIGIFAHAGCLHDEA